MGNPSVALFGGTFDPVHIGHLISARSVREQLSLDEVIFIPSANPPHKDSAPITDVGQRLQMVKIAIGREQGLAFDDCEIKRSGPSFSYETVMHFRERLGEQARICWIIGMDAIYDLDSWHRVSDLVDACEIITTSRPGWDVPDLTPRVLTPRVLAALSEKLDNEQLARLRSGIIETARIDISSTDIRQRVADGMSIQYLVPQQVHQYIMDHGLYGNEVT